MSEGDLVPSVLFFPSTLNALPEIRKKPADPQEISRHRFVTHSLVTEVTGELVASTARSGTGWAARSGTGRSCTAAVAVAAAVTARSGTGWGTAVRRSITAGVLVAALLRLEALLHQATEAAALLLLMAAARGSTAIRRSRSTARSGWGTAARSSAATIAARSGTGRSGTGIAARSGTGWAARSGTARSRTGIAARRCTGRSRVTARVPVQLEQASVGNTRASNDQQGSGQSRPLHLEISRVPGVTVRNR